MEAQLRFVMVVGSPVKFGPALTEYPPLCPGDTANESRPSQGSVRRDARVSETNWSPGDV